MRIQHARVRLAISTDMFVVSVTAPPRLVKDCTCLQICPAASTRTIVRGVRGGGIHTVSVFFADTANANARQNYTITSIILASPCGDRETVQTPPAYGIPHRTTNVVHSRLRSHRRRGLLQVHQLGEDGRILAESLEDNVQHGCEKDVEQ